MSATWNIFVDDISNVVFAMCRRIVKYLWQKIFNYLSYVVTLKIRRNL